ncbi:MAG: helix-turn-helix transcriptional regulator [Nitriliruptorales bacterium]|nr:helix-turn-helix transcriptional regulator [Nitriliruptorales bacterium]
MGDHIATDHQKVIERLANLDDAERELLEMISAGNYDREIAGVLHVSPRTVKRRVADLLETLGVDRRIEAAYLAGEAHLLDGQVDR